MFVRTYSGAPTSNRHDHTVGGWPLLESCAYMLRHDIRLRSAEPNQYLCIIIDWFLFLLRIHVCYLQSFNFWVWFVSFVQNSCCFLCSFCTWRRRNYFLGIRLVVKGTVFPCQSWYRKQNVRLSTVTELSSYWVTQCWICHKQHSCVFVWCNPSCTRWSGNSRVYTWETSMYSLIQELASVHSCSSVYSLIWVLTSVRLRSCRVKFSECQCEYFDGSTFMCRLIITGQYGLDIQALDFFIWELFAVNLFAVCCWLHLKLEF